MPPRKANFGETRIFDVLEEQGRKLDWLAIKTGFSASYICKMRERARYTEEFAEAASEALGLPVSLLFFGFSELDSDNDTPVSYEHDSFTGAK